MEKTRSDISSNLNYLAQALAVGEKIFFSSKRSQK
jgi:hypothetical protein